MAKRIMTVISDKGEKVYGVVSFGGIRQVIGDDIFYSFTEYTENKYHSPLSGRITFEKDDTTPKRFQRLGSDTIHSLLSNPHANVRYGTGGLYDAGIERDGHHPIRRVYHKG